MKIDTRVLNLQPDVKRLSDKVLLEQTSYIAEHERGVTILALRHLREVEIRRLYAELEYSSMWAYCIKHLKYSSNKTSSRLASARLMTELPEIEKQIEEGSLNITSLSKIQSFVRAEKSVQHELNKNEKLALIAECKDKPVRELAKDLIQRSHQPALLAEKFHMTTVVLADGSLNLDYLKFDALLDIEDQEQLQEFKNLYAHDLSDSSNISVLKFLLKKTIQDKKKKLGLEVKSKKEIEISNAARLPSPMVTDNKVIDEKNQNDGAVENPIKPKPRRRVLPVAVRRLVWQRANDCCEHMDHKMKIRCNSKFALQPDHITPLALGGSDEATNLQLLCRVHNSRRAVKTFGIKR